MSYNLSFADNVTNVYEVVREVNTLGNSVPAIMILGFVFLSSYSLFQHSDNLKAFIVSSFLTSIIGGLMWFSSFISWYIAIVPLMMLVISIIVHSMRGY